VGVDRAIAELGGRQHGVVGHRQLLEAGVSREAIRGRVAGGRLHVLHRGVYAVGHLAVSPLGTDVAAVLACGGRAMLSHASAAAVWGLVPRRAGPVAVTVVGSRRRPRPGIALRHTEDVAVDDVRRIHGIRVTAPDRTLLDLAAIGSPELQDAVDAARLRRLFARDALLERAAGRPGARALRAALGGELTRSEGERRFLQIVRRADLPAPETNVFVEGHEVDAVWRAQWLVVELDGYAHHSDRGAFERDRVRDARLQGAGYRVLRTTWRQIQERPEAVAARIAGLLAMR
jgi:very-short-patch-repair endonuclease